VRWLLPTVQTPPRAIWGQSGPPTLAPLEAWLGRPLPEQPTADEVIVRYLRAFGPATTADMRSWSGLGGLREVVDRLGDRLRRYRDAQGRLLVDVADGELADPDLPAPPRFFGNYDNLFLGHADRARIVPVEAREATAWPFGSGGTWVGSFTLDGFAAGAWRITRGRHEARLELRPIRGVTKAERSDLEQEGRRLADFVAPGAPLEIVLAVGGQ
jgi:hypothetical protein